MAHLVPKVFVVGLGVRTPVGHCYQSAAAAVRCGVSAYAEHPYLIDKHGEPMIVSMDQAIGEGLSWLDRTSRMAFGSVTDALKQIENKLGNSITALPTIVAVGRHASNVQLQNQLIAQTNESFPSIQLQFIDEGNAGAMLALKQAQNQISAGDFDFIMIAGVDSHLDARVLESIDVAGRLHSENQSWGFTPGEGAGSILLASEAAVDRNSLTVLAELVSVETAEENNLLGTETVCTGQGLTTALNGVLNESTTIFDIYTDLNGETYRAEEYGFSICRVGKCFDDASRFTTAAECWGDVGAASPTLGVSLAIAAWQGNFDHGEHALVWASGATRPLRGAVVLRDVSRKVN